MVGPPAVRTAESGREEPHSSWPGGRPTQRHSGRPHRILSMHQMDAHIRGEQKCLMREYCLRTRASFLGGGHTRAGPNPT